MSNKVFISHKNKNNKLCIKFSQKKLYDSFENTVYVHPEQKIFH